MVTAFSATVALVVGVVLVWPMMLAISAVTALVAVDAHFAIKARRKKVAITLVVDITIAGAACVLAGVPPVGVAMVTAYFVVLVAVLGRSTRAWPVGLYALTMGVVATSAPVLFDLAEPPIERTIAAGVAAVVVFGVATIEIVRRFVSSIRQRAEQEERRVRMSNAIAVASRALVAEDDARALAFALEAIREAIGAPIAFVEQNVQGDPDGLTAVVVESVTTYDDVHPAFLCGVRTPWRSMPGALAVSRHQPFVKLESIFTHRELNDVFTGVFDVDVDLVRFAAVLFLCALFTFPPPRSLPLAPLQSLATRRPRAIDADVQTVVFRTRRMSTHPHVIAPGRTEMNLVVQHGHLAWIGRKVLAVNQLVVVSASRVREDFEIGTTAGSGHV